MNRYLIVQIYTYIESAAFNIYVYRERKRGEQGVDACEMGKGGEPGFAVKQSNRRLERWLISNYT